MKWKSVNDRIEDIVRDVTRSTDAGEIEWTPLAVDGRLVLFGKHRGVCLELHDEGSLCVGDLAIGDGRASVKHLWYAVTDANHLSRTVESIREVEKAWW